MSEQKPNWVALQTACHIDAVFEALLKVVGKDIDEMKKPSPKQRFHRLDPAGNITTVRRTDDKGLLLLQGDPTVSLEKIASPPCIQICQNPRQNPNRFQTASTHTVTLNWNAETQVCELIWDGDEDHPLDVEQVSERALGPLFSDNDAE